MTKSEKVARAALEICGLILIGNSNAWHQGNYAVDKRKRNIDIGKESAVCWCAEGLVREYLLEETGKESIDVVVVADQLMRQVSNGCIMITYNDSHAKTSEQMGLKMLEAAHAV